MASSHQLLVWGAAPIFNIQAAFSADGYIFINLEFIWGGRSCILENQSECLGVLIVAIITLTACCIPELGIKWIRTWDFPFVITIHNNFFSFKIVAVEQSVDWLVKLIFSLRSHIGYPKYHNLFILQLHILLFIIGRFIFSVYPLIDFDFIVISHFETPH